MGAVPNYTPSHTTLGCIARSVHDIDAVDKVLAGDTGPTPDCAPTLLVPERLVAKYTDETTQKLFAAAVERLRSAGFFIDEFDEPLWEPAERAAGIVSMGEAADHLRSADLALLAPALAERLRLGRTMNGEQVATARETMNHFSLALSRHVARGRLIVSPTWPFRAPRIRQTAAVIQGRRVSVDPHRNVFVRAANAANAPALTIPAGMYSGGIPFGIQLIAPQGGDRDLLSMADLVAKAVMKNSPKPCSI
jgi:Asp-tRNA(Asn)/Glu-tRNA(Gln) amidotransferase A subunit family amidase